MQVSLISIGNCPSLALRNIKCYCLAHEDIRNSNTVFRIFDYHIDEFRQARVQTAQQWSYVTRIDEALEQLTCTKPDVVAFSCYLWNIQLSLHLAQLIKLASPGTLTVFGGPDAGPRAADLLRRHRQVDFVIEGDGEIPFLALMRELDADSPDFSKVPALRFRQDEDVVINSAPAGQADLSLLRGVHDDVPSDTEISRWPWPNLLYETLRGCPYACSYCMYGKVKMNEKDIDLVVEELAALLDKGLTVEIIDPTFTTYRKRAKRILRRLGQFSYSGRLHFEAYPDSIDEEMTELMVAARVSAVGIGFQTLSSEGLKAVKRPKNLDRFESAIRLLDTAKIYYYVDIIYGLPETNLADFLGTVDYLYSLGVDRLMIYRLLGLPGSPIMGDAEKYGLLFSEAPPYELISSNTYSLRDLIFCDRFQHAYERLLGIIPSVELRPMAGRAGGVSRIVQQLVDYGVDRSCDFAQHFKNQLDAPDMPVHNPSASNPANHNNRESVVREVPSG